MKADKLSMELRKEAFGRKMALKQAMESKLAPIEQPHEEEPEYRDFGDFWGNDEDDDQDNNEEDNNEEDTPEHECNCPFCTR